jgi:pyruvate carboxylase
MARTLHSVPQSLAAPHIRGRVDHEVPGSITAPFGGVVTFAVSVGEPVDADTVVATLEAMKLEAAITTPTPGRVARLAIRDQATVEGGDLLLVIE